MFLIVLVCRISFAFLDFLSYLRIFGSSLTSFLSSAHLRIFSKICSHLLSHLLIFTPSLTSSHLHILSPSHLLSFLSPFSLSRLLYLSLFRREQGQGQQDGTKRNPFARNEVRSSKTEVKLLFQVVPRNPFTRNEVRSPKIEEKNTISNLSAQPFPRNEVRSSKLLFVKESMCKSVCV